MKHFAAGALSLFMALAAAAGPRDSALKAASALAGSQREQEALEFLYRYMPVADVTACSPEFFAENVAVTFAAADSLGWNVPEREFRHFVLPLRVNNEALDNSRPLFFAELLPRIKGMSMADAILEVNHWCHEKVTYRPSDPRTSSPLASVSNAIGRCGEESTFTVAALRAVGIPARQVYTPRWAHTDDNHAWVEAWADGKWHFLGACEPEPVLDLGWFNEPASRGMLMSTKAFGAYDGPEEVLAVTPLTTEINVTSNYAPTGTVTVTVTDSLGRPLPDATVQFSLYNYAEYFPLTRKVTDAEGRATFLCGEGDVVVWATDGSRYAFCPANPLTAPSVTLALTDRKADTAVELDLVPPALHSNLPALTDEQVALNNRRKAAEDSIRAAYTATFATDASARSLAASLGMPADRLSAVMTGSRGNHGTLASMFASLTPADRLTALALLEVLPPKDLCDIRPEVVTDALEWSRPFAALTDSATYINYVLSPRVSWEPLSVSKRDLASQFAPEARSRFAADPAQWVQWVADSVAIVPAENPHRFEIHPEEVARWRIADTRSRNIFFVAGARSFGIPARIHPVTGKVQYLEAPERWIDVNFDAPEALTSTSVPARLTLTSEAPLKYFYHYSLSRIEGGLPVQLDFDDAVTVEEANKEFAALDPGDYILTTGQRLADGSVLARSELFTLRPGQELTLAVIQRHNPEAIEVTGNFDAENLYCPLGSDEPQSIISTTGRGFYTLGIISAGHEPSAHALNDIAAAAAELEKAGRPLMILFADKATAERFDASLFPAMPGVVTMGYIPEGSTVIDEIVADQHLDTKALPLFIIADTFNRIVALRQGYTIGLGNYLAEVLERLK
nr:transglutaminase domain-containing protein [Bacteroides sp.]